MCGNLTSSYIEVTPSELVLLQSVSLREELQSMPPVKKVITAVSLVCSIAISSAMVSISLL